MTELINVYITKNKSEMVSRITRRLEENGIEAFVNEFGHGAEVLVKRHEKERADILVYNVTEGE